MLLRTCLILAILAGLGVIGVSHFMLRPQIEEIIQVRNHNKEEWDKTQKRLDKTNVVLKATREKLSKTEATLEETKRRVTDKLAPTYEKPFSAYGDYRPWRGGLALNIERTYAMVG